MDLSLYFGSELLQYRGIALSQSLYLYKHALLMLYITFFPAPSAPPQNLRGNFTNSTAIRLHWDLVVQQDRNGEITKYVVQYKIQNSPAAWKEIEVGPDLLTLHLLKLEYYTMYQFKIAAETAMGRGPFSNLIFIRTDAYGKTFIRQTANNGGARGAVGIFPTVLFKLNHPISSNSMRKFYS